MATEKDFELLDDYLSNRLKGQDRLDFEKKIESDMSLRNELGLQKEFIEGIKKARVAELKTMLSEIATPAPTNSSLLAKVGLTAAAVAVVGMGLYFLFGKGDSAIESTHITKEQPAAVQPSAPEETISNDKTEEVVVTPQPEDKVKEQLDNKAKSTQPDKKAETSTPLQQPSLEPYDPTKELEQASERPDVVDERKTTLSSSSIEVETDNTNKKLDFHYQFKDGKLFLLGSFERDLYEILEFFNNNKRTIFLYYNSGYYLLDEGQTQPTPLKAINDPALLQKLKAYRSK